MGLTFARLEAQFSRAQTLEKLREAGEEFLNRGGKDNNVVEVDEARAQVHAMHDALHHAHERGARVAESEGHLAEAVDPRMDRKTGFVRVAL